MVALSKLLVFLLLMLTVSHQQFHLSVRAEADIDCSNDYEVWNILSANTMYPERLGNWKEWKQQLSSAKEEHNHASAVSSMVSALNDDYTYFQDAHDTRLHQDKRKQRRVVSGRLMPGDFGYIRISTFHSNYVCEELQDILHMLEPASFYVLDLRDNRGGNIYEAQKACGMFLDKGIFSTLKGRLDGKPFKERLEISPTRLLSKGTTGTTRSCRVANLTGKKPLVILVNHNTRSAAEMMAGCLRDHRRATLVGERTFGKGVVQSTWTLSDGSSIKIATAKHYLPSGRNIHGIGLDPDVVVDCADNAKDSALSKAIDLLRPQTDRSSFVRQTATLTP